MPAFALTGEKGECEGDCLTCWACTATLFGLGGPSSSGPLPQTLLPPPRTHAGLFKDNIYCHIASGLGAGFFAVCVGSPVDVVKSRMMGTSSRLLHGCFRAMDGFVKAQGPSPGVHGRMGWPTSPSCCCSWGDSHGFDQARRCSRDGPRASPPHPYPPTLLAGAAPGVYSGVGDAFVKTFKRDGPLAFYNGFGPNFARLGT